VQPAQRLPPADRKCHTLFLMIIGTSLRRSDEQAVASPLLRIAYTHLKAYEARQAPGATSKE